MVPPLFSLIVPIYNVESYISNCLDSILGQSFTNYELILINNGSTDNSYEICMEYANNYEQIFLHNINNNGVSHARNYGLHLAKGAYIWFIDSDDWIEPDSLKTLSIELQKENNLEMLGFYENRYYEKENKTVSPKKLQEIPLTDGNNYIEQSERFVSPLWVYLYKRSFVIENNFSFISVLLNEDDHFNLSCFSKVKFIKRIDAVFYNYRIRSNSLIRSNDYEKRIQSNLELIKLCSELKKTNLNHFFLDSRIRSYISVLFFYLQKYSINNNSEIINEYINKIKKIVPFQKIYLKDMKGVILEKLIYNLSKSLFMQFKKVK